MSKYIELINKILEEYPIHKNFLDKMLENISEFQENEINNYLDFAEFLGLTIEYLAECYVLVVKDTFREQIYFRRHKKYRYNNFSEVANSVYYNENYMSRYMYGLAITTFLWPQHYRILQFFDKNLPNIENGNYLEIGPGHGYYFTHALKKTNYDNYLGIDLSPTSIDICQKFVDFSGLKMKNTYLVNQDFLTTNFDEKYDAIVMGEVLEHVEKPELFLDKISNIARENAFIYITTVINAPAIDHITLFRNFEEIENLIKQSGLIIQNKILLDNDNKTDINYALQNNLPLNIAMVLTNE